MKVVVAVVLVAACSGTSPPGHSTTDGASSDGPPIDPCGALPLQAAPEALPPPHCGMGGCTCCTSCSISDGLCFGSVTSLSFGTGQCVASPVPGAVDVRVLSEHADGTRAVVSHFNKATKGELARLLATAPIECTTVEDVIAVAERGGFTVERRGERELGVVVPA